MSNLTTSRKKNNKTISVYDAQTKKPKAISVNIKDLSEYEIKQKVDKIKQDQKVKNMMYKQEKLKLPLQIEKIIEPLVDVESQIDLKLNHDTGNTTFLLGSSQRGKSTVLMYLYDKYYSGSDFISILYAINYQIKHYQNRKNLKLCSTFNKQSEKLIRMEKYINTKCKNKYKFCNMFDDIIDQKYNKLLNELILSFRNSNMSSLISLQYPKALNRSQRTNIHNVLLFGFNNDEAIIDIIKYWLKGFFTKLGYKSEGEQIEFYKKMTENYGFIYVSSLHNHISFHRLKI
jgi:hypothetical protein